MVDCTANINPKLQGQYLSEEVLTAREKRKSFARYLRTGSLVLFAGVVLLLLGCFGIRYYWKGNGNKVYNTLYRINIHGAIEESIMEINAADNFETFSMGNGSHESVEIHDFKAGLTGIRFAGGEKCYIKTQTKIILPDIAAIKNDEELISPQDEIMPAQFDESLVWMAAEQPIKDQHFLLNSKVLEVCGNLPVYWLRPSYLKDTEFYDFGDPQEVAGENEHATELKSQTNRKRPARDIHDYTENEIYVDRRLDEQGFCCADCHHGHTHCRRICEPLGGYMPYPYYYRGCRVICVVVMPCNWWVARMLGRV
ncbi:tenomodulin [Callorhinchus milii]|uniref:tenomodulin n=1 Tax=Callorhinchus milii TaxID=7868 RepID=UPI0004572C66|nr:tenomodulin [Callorhinchus milii]|eukprot:gi/632936173/ref/XP_007892732.1/ PREDICTED: leukocyte cell-derived chemotaxin 1-like [Callorhinchus milii]